MGRSVLDKFFWENDPLDETKQKILSFQEVGQKRKMWSKSNLPLSNSPDRKMFPFKKGVFFKSKPKSDKVATYNNKTK